MKTIDFSYFIERFNAGEMNEAEEAWFRKELEDNHELRAESELRKRADAALMNHDIMNLRQKLSSIEKQRKVAEPVRSNRKKLQLGIAAAVTGLIIIGSIALFHGRAVSNDELVSKYAKSFEGVYASRSASENANEDYSAGIAYYNVHDYENAVRYFSKVVKADPGDMGSTMYFGTSSFELKNYPAAKELFHKVIDNNDNLYIEDAELYLVFCYLKTNENNKAIDQLQVIKDSRSIYRTDAAKMLRNLKK